MPMSSARRRINVDLSAESYSGWESFGLATGGSFTAIAEIIGRRLAAAIDADGNVDEEWAEVARDVSAHSFMRARARRRGASEEDE